MALSLERYRSTYPKKSRLTNILTKRNERQRKKSLGVSIKNGNRIPVHLIIEILSRLPVKTLLQFKSVCKLWYNIIKSSHFISKHLRNYYDDNNNWRDCLIVQYSVTQAGELNVYELLIDDKKNRVLAYQKIDTPVYNTYMCGPCDGIYYLWCFSYNTPTRSLWNPALNEFMGLPDITWKPNLPPESTYLRESYGFGYDSKNNDYKVILILVYCAQDENCEYTDITNSILIYSLRSNSWRYWGDIDNSHSLESSRSYVFVNGCYYWLALGLSTDGWNYEMIISFDISGETCQEIPLPEFESRPDFVSHVIVYQDSIAFVSVPNDNTSFCVWTWNEGVWTQKFSIKLIDSGVRGIFGVLWDNRLVFNKGYRKLVLCDPNTKEIFALDGSQPGGCENICAYKESLVSIKNFGKKMKRKGRTS